MGEHETGQVTRSAAEVYEAFFVPALFQQWPSRLIEAAAIRPGSRVLDVACGTGVLARTVAERIGPEGTVVGLDLNEDMLAVAAQKAPGILWRHGRAEALPFGDAHFDAVVSQFGLMFFEDRRAALREMVRVLRPGGRLAVAVWGALEHTPGYAVLADLLQRLFGEEVTRGLRVPFELGNRDLLRALFAQADLPQAEVTVHEGTARFPSIRSWMYTEIKGWTLAGMLDEDQFAVLVREAEEALRPFVEDGGTVAFSAPAYLVTAGKA